MVLQQGGVALLFLLGTCDRWYSAIPSAVSQSWLIILQWGFRDLHCWKVSPLLQSADPKHCTLRQQALCDCGFFGICNSQGCPYPLTSPRGSLPCTFGGKVIKMFFTWRPHSSRPPCGPTDGLQRSRESGHFCLQ